MPELPEVEAVCRRLCEQALGSVIRELRVLRPSITRPQPAHDVERLCAGRRVAAVERAGKNIAIRLDDGQTVNVHLRMTGNLYVIPDARFLTTAIRAVFILADGRGIVFEDPRALGTLHANRPVTGLGVEPLSPDFTPDSLRTTNRQSAKVFLLDQHHVCGLGNIYVAEALFLAGIDPRRPMAKLTRARRERLHSSIVRVLNDAVHSAYSGYTAPGRLEPAEGEQLKVYGREGEPCRSCGRAIRRIVQAGRSTYFCPGCQT
ncbi:MAG: bifunctional DNA-formamidopyrimidine glycosylase/DNA-(apurinic or apyrimidinic site) lyase [Acidobacteria bacterium]|nr:bifunctional DNA-formamidopyrimidine glycosylase/DNA-(apurinic or apyrimidinic site) lyase [Acidobacteriota bacterium]